MRKLADFKAVLIKGNGMEGQDSFCQDKIATFLWES
jgi:hypothetical protein